MPFTKKGEKRPPGAGRRKGTPNKLNQKTRELIRDALSEVGGVEHLVKAAKSKKLPERLAFLALVGKTTERHHEHEVKVLPTVTVRNFTNLRLDRLKPSILRQLTKED